MHRLVIMRHAKSDWTAGLADQERPLARRGRRNATAAGEWLLAAGLEPDLALVSPARRTRQTWQLVSDQLHAEIPTDFEASIYLARWTELLELIQRTDDGVGTLAVVGHNPGCERLANELASPESDQGALRQLQLKYPTMGTSIFGVSTPWAELEVGGARLIDFVVPRSNQSSEGLPLNR
ncbi:MAG: histidine phosphatase family protein [Actinobacteria bacterium]|nr:histidine phosphatase family protein [Actinomycetota bacterium]